MARIQLIHGASHGAWAWHRVLPELAARGHDARAIDLPSHGADTTPLSDVTLERYAEAIRTALDGPTIVVGHSMAGFPITLAAARDPRITRLVYLCAYVPAPGLSLAEMRKLHPEQPLRSSIRRNPDGISMHFDAAMTGSTFYHDCAPEDVTDALPRLCDQALAPMETALTEAEATPRCPRSYIVCDQDCAIPPDLQAQMASTACIQDVYHMNTSHSPFLSDPEGLARILNDIVGAS